MVGEIEYAPERDERVFISSVHTRYATPRRMKKLAMRAIHNVCGKARDEGYRPITIVDDLSMNRLGPWLDAVSIGLTRAALIEKVSITGGEMAQMPDTYKSGYVGIIVCCYAVKV